VHLPVHYPMAYLRGKRRLIRVTLVDCKPLSWPPILGDELHVLPLSNRALVSATLTEKQNEGMMELALVK